MPRSALSGTAIATRNRPERSWPIGDLRGPDVGVVTCDLQVGTTTNEAVLGVDLEVDTLDLAEERLDRFGSLKVGWIVVEVLRGCGVRRLGATTAATIAGSTEGESLGLEGAGDLLRDGDGGTVVVVAGDGLTDQRVVGIAQHRPIVEEGGDFLLEPHGNAAPNELGPISSEQLGADLDRQGVALHLDKDAVVQLVELGPQFEVLRGPVRVDLAVGGDEERVTVCDEVAALAFLATFGEETEPDR